MFNRLTYSIFKFHASQNFMMEYSNIWYSLCFLNASYTRNKLIELEVDMSMNLGFCYSLLQ